MFKHYPKNIGKQILRGMLFGFSIAVTVTTVLAAIVYWQINREANNIAEHMYKSSGDVYDPTLHVINDYKNNPASEPTYSPEEQVIMDDFKKGKDWIGPYDELYGLRFYQYSSISEEARKMVSASPVYENSFKLFRDATRGYDVEVWGEIEGKYIDYAKAIKSGTSRFERVKGIILGYYQ